MKRYPHKLYKVVLGESTINDFGQEVPGESELVFVSMCYEQVMKESKEMRGNGGVSFSYSSIVFLPDGVTQIPTGTIVEVREIDETVRLKAEVKRPSGKDVKHSRLWL